MDENPLQKFYIIYSGEAGLGSGKTGRISNVHNFVAPDQQNKRKKNYEIKQRQKALRKKIEEN
jgi:hypothetical protein